MRPHRILLLVLTLVLVTLWTTPVAAGSVERSTGLTVRSMERSGRLVEASVDTPALADRTHVRILLPDGYDANPGKRYPVLYLLHGASDNYRWWTDLGDAARTTAGVPVIVVMPDGGQVGWYSDWFNGGAGGHPEWETYHIDQLVPWVDAKFRTQPENRAIAGLSMGGFGAMSYAARHPGMFDAAASFSGALDLNGVAFVLAVDMMPLAVNQLPMSVFGSKVLNADRWRAHNPWDIAENLRGMHLAVYTGNGLPGPYEHDPTLPDLLEFFVHDASTSFHNRLESLGIQHTFLDYGPGTHTAPYWARDLRMELPAIMNSFTTAAAH